MSVESQLAFLFDKRITYLDPENAISLLSLSPSLFLCQEDINLVLCMLLVNFIYENPSMYPSSVHLSPLVLPTLLQPCNLTKKPPPPSIHPYLSYSLSTSPHLASPLLFRSPLLTSSLSLFLIPLHIPPSLPLTPPLPLPPCKRRALSYLHTWL